MLTGSLVALGVLFVLLFESVAGSFKQMMISDITDSMLGHFQIHRKGFVASIETLPLTLNLQLQQVAAVEELLNKNPEIEAFSPRIKFGGMFSTFNETTNVRLIGVDPDREFKTVPLLPTRIVEGEKALRRGQILVPELLAKGMKVKAGDVVVVIATNKEGSVNGKQLTIGGVLSSVTGPGGRDGYVHIKDAEDILRLEKPEVSEIAVRVADFGRLENVVTRLEGQLAQKLNKQGKPVFEVHAWDKLSPFANVATMIDVLTVFIKIMLISIVLVSIMNVMVMAVYERVREIGTMAAIGTSPRRILSMFLLEGFCLGALGAFIGTALGLLAVVLLRQAQIPFKFGQQQGLILMPAISLGEIALISIIVILVSVIASFQPAFRAARMEPIQALRHV